MVMLSIGNLRIIIIEVCRMQNVSRGRIINIFRNITRKKCSTYSRILIWSSTIIFNKHILYFLPFSVLSTLGYGQFKVVLVIEVRLLRLFFFCFWTTVGLEPSLNQLTTVRMISPRWQPCYLGMTNLLFLSL